MTAECHLARATQIGLGEGERATPTIFQLKAQGITFYIKKRKCDILILTWV